MSIHDGQGYYLNDDRASGGVRIEDDMIACEHRAPGCTGNIMRKSEWKAHGGFCFACAKPICLHCAERTRQFGCEGPEEKRIEQAVNEQYRITQNAKILGV